MLDNIVKAMDAVRDCMDAPNPVDAALQARRDLIKKKRHRVQACQEYNRACDKVHEAIDRRNRAIDALTPEQSKRYLEAIQHEDE